MGSVQADDVDDALEARQLCGVPRVLRTAHQPARRGLRRLPARQFGLTTAIASVQTDTVDNDQLSAAITSDDPSIGLRAVLALRRLAEQVEANQVALARRQGWSWQQIGDALGITRQSVHAKYRR